MPTSSDNHLAQVLSLASGLFAFVISVDVTNDRFVALKSYKDYLLTDKEYDFTAFVTHYISKNVTPAYQKEVLDYCNLEKIKQESNEPLRTIKYQTNNKGWIKAASVIQERDANGIISKMLVIGYDITTQEQKLNELTYLTHQDVLTGLKNRRSYEQLLASPYELLDNLYVMAININGLTTINEAQGHEAGDKMIIHTANAITKAIGPSGEAYRIGGGQFVVLVNCSQDEMNTILSNMDQYLREYKDEFKKGISISRGVVHISELENPTLHQLELEADRQMYVEEQNYYRNLNGLLDDINQQIEIIDSATYELLYANKETLKSYGRENGTYEGQKCYSYLMHKEKPCEFCPIVKMTQDDKAIETEIESEERVFNAVVKKVIWQGRKAHALFIQDFTEIRHQQQNYEFNLKMLTESVPNAIGIYFIDLEAKTITAFKDGIKSPHVGLGLVEDFYFVKLKDMMDENDFIQFENTFSVSALMAMHKNGIMSLSEVIKCATKKGQKWYKFTAKIIQNPTTDQVHALLYVTDVNKEHEKKLRTERLLWEAERKIEEEKENNEKMQYLDIQTGTLNMRGFVENIKKTLTMMPDEYYGILYIDFKNFAYINNTYGMDYGDKIIKEFAKQTEEKINLRSHQYTCHINGGTFAYFIRYDNMNYAMHNINGLNNEALTTQFKEISESFLQSFDMNVDLRYHAGLYFISPMDAFKIPVEQMIENAGNAMRQAKQNNNEELTIFNLEDWEKQKRKIRISHLFESALENNEFYLAYQPLVDNRSNTTFGAEALCRWNSPELGEVGPLEFISVLEANNQVTKLDLYVWENVCRQLAKWKKENKFIIPISVNVSRIDLTLLDIREVFTRLIERYHLEPWMVKIEITETAFIEDTAKAVQTIKALKNAGFTVQMDDFGSGYSSLNMLKKFPVDIVKLDMKFMEYQDEKESATIIIESIIKMAKRLKMTVISEGVETADQNELLKSLGCYHIQGYYYSKPLNIDDLESLIAI